MNIKLNLLCDDDDEKILEFINYCGRPYTVRERIKHMMK